MRTDRATIHRVIYDELCLGTLSTESKQEFLEIIGELSRQGADGVVLGCTEIPLLIRQEDVDMPVFDTTSLHVEMAISWALQA